MTLPAADAKPRQYLIDARHRAGLNQTELAALVGCEALRISRFERGRQIPSLRYQIALAKVLQIPLLELQRRCDWPQTPDLMIKGLEG